jgi:PAS domain S-box-containing protein
MSEARTDDDADGLTSFAPVRTAAKPKRATANPPRAASTRADSGQADLGHADLGHAGPPRAGMIQGPRAMLAVAAVFTLLAAACAIAGVLAWRDIQATSAVVDARQSRLNGSLVLEAMLSAESAQRGYLLTRDPAYLANYNNAKARFATALAELHGASSNRTPRASLIRDLARTGVEKFGELDQTIALGQASRFDEALAVVRSGSGKASMEELSQAVDDLTAETNDEVARTTATQSHLTTLLVGAIVVALLCVTGLAVLLLNDARRSLGLLQTREIGARQLAETLEQRVAQRTRELADANQRFNAALRTSGVTVATQDRDLVFTWISRDMFGRSAETIIGKSQQEVIPEPAAANLKRGVIETGEPARGDIRISHDGQETWYDLTVHPLTDEHGGVTGIIAGEVDITRYKEQEARIRLLMRELTHRSKNLLTVIQAIMRQTASNSGSIEDFETRFSARLQSLAGSHDLLVREDWQGASMRELVRSQLGHYIDRADQRIELIGEPLRIRPDAAQHIGMAMHELATNAAKYGALSTPDGKVRISWSISPAPDSTPMCHLSWVECGGPPVERPSRRGFGRVVIERTVARALSGDVRIDYAPAGLRWTLEFPHPAAADP